MDFEWRFFTPNRLVQSIPDIFSELKALVEKIPEEQRSRQEEALERLWDTYKQYQDNPLTVKTDNLYKSIAFPSMFMAKTLQAIDLPHEAIQAANLATECFNLAKWEQKMVESLMTYLYCRLNAVQAEDFVLDQVQQTITEQVKTICRHRGYESDPRPACSFDLPLRRAQEAVWNTFSQHMERLSEENNEQYLAVLERELKSAWNFPSHDRLKERVRLFREQVSALLPEQVRLGIESGALRPFHEEIIPSELHDQIREAVKAGDKQQVVELISPTVESQLRTLGERLGEVLAFKPPYRPRSLPRDVYGRWVAAERLDSEGEISRAEQAFSQLFSEEPEYPILKEWLAYCQARLGNLTGAQRLLEQVVNVKRSNYLTFWNLACIHFKLEDLESAQKYLDQDFLLQNNMRNTDFIESILGLTILLGWDERVLHLIDHFPTNEYAALGLYLSNKIGNEERAANYLDRLLQLLSGPISFDPARVPGLTDPRPGAERLKRAFSYFIASGLEEQGAAYFIQRTRNFPNSYIDLEYLGCLYENMGKLEQAKNAFLRKAQITNRSRAHVSTKREVTSQLLQFVVRHKLTTLDPELLEEARELEVDQWLIEQAEPLIAQAAVEEIRSQPFSIDESAQPQPRYEQLPPPEPPRPVEPIDAAQLAADCAKLIKLDDLIPAYVLAERAVPGLEALGQVEGNVAATVRDALELARGIVEDQELEASHGDLDALNKLRIKAVEAQSALVGERAGSTSALVQMVERLVTELGRDVRLLPDLTIEAISPFLSSDAATTSLVLVVENREPMDQHEVSVTLDPVGDAAELLVTKKISIGEIPAGGRAYVKFKLRPIQSEGKAAFKVRAELTVNKQRCTVEPSAPLRVTVTDFFKAAGVSAITSPFLPLRDIPANRGELFVGRDNQLRSLTQSLSQIPQGRVPFLDGIKRVGKTSLFNFLAGSLPDEFCVVRLNLEGLLADPQTSKFAFYKGLCNRIAETMGSLGCLTNPPDLSALEKDPDSTLGEFFNAVSNDQRHCVLLFDEFQYAVEAILAKAKNGVDSSFLSLLSAAIDDGRFSAAFSSARRLDDLLHRLQHNLFSRVVRVELDLLTRRDHDQFLSSAFSSQKIVFPEELLQAAYQQTGGHPAFVHLLGDWLVVHALGEDMRTVLIPDDVLDAAEALAREEVYFSTWWDASMFNELDALVTRRLTELGSAGRDELLSSVSAAEQLEGRQSVERLMRYGIFREQDGKLSISAGMLSKHLSRLIETRGNLPYQTDGTVEPPVARNIALFVDHENLFLSLQTKLEERGIDLRDNKRMQHVIERLREQASQLGPMARCVAVANWDNPVFSAHQRLYRSTGFDTLMPPDADKDGADFEIYDEISRVSSEEPNVGTFILVSADRDFSRIIMRLRNQEGRSVRVWAVRGVSLSERYKQRLGKALEYVDDIIKL
ncbi:MAG: NYN domain-containing protein [Candidatus Alcyoniella australis]|nr:NYN domain-containing protein [Candidatus Alcyoniella australis]